MISDRRRKVARRTCLHFSVNSTLEVTGTNVRHREEMGAWSFVAAGCIGPGLDFVDGDVARSGCGKMTNSTKLGSEMGRRRGTGVRARAGRTGNLFRDLWTCGDDAVDSATFSEGRLG